MPKSALSITQLGREVCWTLVKQAMGIPDAKMPSDYMSSRVALLLFKRTSLPERLCVTAAVRQMSGSTIYQSASENLWQEEARSLQIHLFPILGYFLDCLYLYGFPTASRENSELADFPVINAGCADGHPAHALADLACMLRVAKKLEGVHAAWIGCVNGTLHSLIESMAWFPFSLAVSLPPDADDAGLKAYAVREKLPVTFVGSPGEAVRDSSFVFAGRKPDEITPENEPWSLTPDLLARAKPEARILLSATPIRAIPVASELIRGKRSLLVRQAEYRLCVHKRILHWVFSKN